MTGSGAACGGATGAGAPGLTGAASVVWAGGGGAPSAPGAGVAATGVGSLTGGAFAGARNIAIIRAGISGISFITDWPELVRQYQTP